MNQNEELDLSWSGIVNRLQGDQKEATDMLKMLSKAIIEQGDRVDHLAKKLDNERTYLNSLKGGVVNVFKHMQHKGDMLYVERGKLYRVQSDGGVAVEQMKFPNK